MRPYTISFVRLEHVGVRYTPQKWWDKWRWALVRRLGGACPLDTTRIDRYVIDGATFADKLFKQKRELFERFDLRGATVLMGAEDYRELMSGPDVVYAFSFASEFNYNRLVYGFNVRVLPWLRGVVVMPLGEDL